MTRVEMADNAGNGAVVGYSCVECIAFRMFEIGMGLGWVGPVLLI